jgi:hypothetical protein
VTLSLLVIDDLIPSRRDEGRWRKVKELQIKDIKASLKTLDAGHLDTLAAMGKLARSHPKSFKIALYNAPIILHAFLLSLYFLCYDPMWKQLPHLGNHSSTQETKDSMALYCFIAHNPDQTFQNPYTSSCV